MFLVFNSALKGLDDTPQPKSKAVARWIVVKVRDLNKTSTYIYYLCVCTLIVVNVELISKFHYIFSVIDKKEALSAAITSCTRCQR